MKAMPFLTAKWTHLAMLTYAVPPALLEASLPPGCELDLAGKEALASLVAFDFEETRVLGIPWPGFRRFAEVNLRFYVRFGDDHGVCFLRELVGKRIVAAVARAFYNEPFAVMPVTSQIDITAERVVARREVILSDQKFWIETNAGVKGALPTPGSIEHFITEQEWGFGTSRAGKLLRYRVEHPPWEIMLVHSIDFHWDWKTIYGPRWAFLQDRRPVSVMLVAGSAVRLFPKGMVQPHRVRTIQSKMITGSV